MHCSIEFQHAQISCKNINNFFIVIFNALILFIKIIETQITKLSSAKSANILRS